VLRAQVIAATDISSGTLIARTAISYTWSVYQPGAALQVEQVVGHRALQNLRVGEVIRSTFVSPEQVTTP
jgi:flagella basal body P-ring formation protein FlgA